MSKHIGIDAEDQWKIHGEDFLEDANAMPEAAGVPELLEVLSKAKELLEQATEIDFDGTAHIAISDEDSCAMRKIIEKILNGDCMPNEKSKNSTPPPPPAPPPPRQIREGIGIVKPRQPLSQSEGASMNDKERFRTTYVAYFLASYMASRYDYDCVNGNPLKVGQPIEDAFILADEAWGLLGDQKTGKKV
jgi:hypothetical protein